MYEVDIKKVGLVARLLGSVPENEMHYKGDLVFNSGNTYKSIFFS